MQIGVEDPNELLDQLPAGVLLFGDDSLIVSSNTTFRTLFGYEEEEVAGTHIEMFFSTPSKIFYQTHVFPLLRMKGRVDEIYLSGLSKNGSEIPVLVNAVRTNRDGVAMTQCLLTPMRRRNEYEDELLKAKALAEGKSQETYQVFEALKVTHEVLAEREEELRSKYEELEMLRGSLERRVEDRTLELTSLLGLLRDFNYSLAHDLRTPIRTMVGASDLLLADFHEGLNWNQKELLISQKNAALKLLSLIDDLFTFSKLARYELHRTEVDLSCLFKKVANTVAIDKGRHDIEIALENDLVAFADEKMVELALRHLIDNAIKYSPDGGQISFGAASQGNDGFFFLKDQGVGLDQKFAPKIFRPFERLHRDEEFPGNGAGLAIVDRIVNMHRGKIYVESSVGQGATFYLSLGDPNERNSG